MVALSDPAPAKVYPKFGTPEIDRMAERISEWLESDLSQVASNRGTITLIPYATRDVGALSDAEVTAYLLGVYSMATSFGSWLDESLADGDHSAESHSAIVRNEVTYDQIKQLVAGAEGECFHRRHPEKPVFAGRMRKINAVIAKIRAFRVELEDKPHASEEASEFGYTWYSGGSFDEVHTILRKAKFSRDLDDEQRRAWERVDLECAALEKLINRARNAASDRRKNEYQARFGKGVA